MGSDFAIQQIACCLITRPVHIEWADGAYHVADRGDH